MGKRQVNGRRLRGIREDQILGMREVAQQAGISYATLQKMETKNYTPKPENIRAVARALGVNPAVFCESRKTLVAVA